MLFPLLVSAQNPAPAPPKIEPVKTTITVVEHVSAEAPADISVMSRQELQETPGNNLDDRLRDIPGFSLFRRSSSLVAHPTTQGVSLRGIGSSGASRSLVLWDGIPMNDPFGGWVYWTLLSPMEMDRVEVSRGASTSLFGDRAMSGAIALFSRPAEPLHLNTGFEAGNRNTADTFLGFSNLWSRWAVSGFGRAFTTDGYFIVPADERGTVDTASNVRFVTGDVRLDYLGGLNQFFLRTGILAEERHNGTVLQHNSTGLGDVALHYQRNIHNDYFSVLAYHTQEDFRSSFSAVAASRNFERLTYNQEVPSDATGGAATWQHDRGGWNLLGGADANRVEGWSNDHLYPTGLRVGGGRQLQHGLFFQTDKSLGPARFFLGARDSWTGQGGTFWSPNAGAVVGRGRLRARASVYRSFRAPTLNELFRDFRVGNTDTRPNPLLRPESMVGSEVGVDVIGETSSLRLTAYHNSLDNLITNVTLLTAPNQIIRQRQNAAAAVSQGFEADARKRFGNFNGELHYLFVNSRFNTHLWVSQVPRHQGSAQLFYQKGGLVASLGMRSYSAQFDDDLNQYLLPGFATVEGMVRQRLTASLSAVLELDNALDHSYAVGTSAGPNPKLPIFLTGEPRMWRAGLRWDGR